MTRIIIADDHKIMREGLRYLLGREPELDVVAEADNGRDAVRLAEEHKPDVVLMDVSMPEMNGIEATRRIIAELDGIKVLTLSMHADKRYVVEALSAGAKGYILKDCASDELLGAIRAILAGELYLCSKVAGCIVNDYLGGHRAPTSSLAVLSPREREVLQLIAEGKSTKEAAFTLSVSVKTVETQRASIMRKLGLSSVADLTKFAIREGLVSLE